MASSNQDMPPPKRAFSLPAKAAPIRDPQIDVLYALPSARIIAFSTSRTNSRPSSSNGIALEVSPQSDLAWGSPYERTIAVGTLCIYRAPSSVFFLQCQKALRPILKKSQAWCVDGEGKFVLQIRPPEYWRIEVPYATPEEQLIVHGLKEVLQTVLLYEKTVCPFKRPFQVELPEAPQTPVKKKPWKPVERPKAELSPLSAVPETPKADPVSTRQIKEEQFSASPSTRQLLQSPKVDSLVAAIEEQIPAADITFQDSDVSVSPSPSGPPSMFEVIDPLDDGGKSTSAELLPLSPEIPENHEDIIVPDASASSGKQLPEISDTYPYEEGPTDDEESILSELPPSLGTESPEGPISSMYEGEPFIFTGEESDSFSDATDDTGATLEPTYQPLVAEQEPLNKPPALQKCIRLVTAPPILSLITSPPSKPMKTSTSPLRCSTITESSSELSSSSDSFHSIQSWHSPLAPPSPPASGPSSPVTYPYPHENISLPKRTKHIRDNSELTAIPGTPGVWNGPDALGLDFVLNNASSTSKVPGLVEDRSDKPEADASEILTPPTVRPTTRHRTTTSSNSRRRELSPLPPAVNLFSPRRRRRPKKLETARHLPTAIIQKTYEILISPPSHLFQMMIKIASKIAAGEWRGVLSGYGEAVHWDFEDEYGNEAWFEDDYGISLPNPRAKAMPTREMSTSTVTGGSWEVD